MEWIRGDAIGYGSFSTVNLAITTNPSARFPQIMAVKSACLSQTDMLLREKSILDELQDCPHIVKCFGSDYTVEKGEKRYNIFLEYAPGGTLADKIKNRRDDHGLPEHETRRYTKNILEGVRYVHEKDYVHSDLKLENILLFPSSKDSNQGEVKIADFGLATKTLERVQRQEICGTPLYISPEAVSEGKMGPPGDVWAIGCMMAEMVTGAPAWQCPETNIFGLLMRIGIGDELPEIPKGLSVEGKDFLSKIFVKDPKKRWTAQMLLNHPFITTEQSNTEDCRKTSPRGPLDCIDEDESELFSMDFDLNVPLPDLEKRCSGQVDLKKASCEITKLPLSDFDIWNTSSDVGFESNADRLLNLVSCQVPDWSETDGWINVR